MEGAHLPWHECVSKSFGESAVRQVSLVVPLAKGALIGPRRRETTLFNSSQG
jgi:hypothetical protein